MRHLVMGQPADVDGETLPYGTYLLVVVVDSVDNVLLAVLEDPPDGAPDHVPGGDGRDDEALALAAQAYRLVVLQLTDQKDTRHQSIKLSYPVFWVPSVKDPDLEPPGFVRFPQIRILGPGDPLQLPNHKLF